MNMSRCLSQELIQYQKAEEASIMSVTTDMDESQRELVRQFYESVKITAEDINRQYSALQVKQLCLRTKVRVNMTLFNCLWDAKKRLDAKGRLTNRSESFINRMMVKSVNKKMVFPYTNEEVSRMNHIRQCHLKKRNNQRLDRWSRETDNSHVIESDNTNPSLMLAQVPNELHAQPVKDPSVNLIFPSSGNSNEPSVLPAPAAAAATSIAVDVSKPGLWGMDKTGDSNNNLVEPVDQQNMSTEISSNSIPDWIPAANRLNTDSLGVSRVDIESQTQNTESQFGFTNYLDFNTEVPCTSTQTQLSSQGTEPFL